MKRYSKFKNGSSCFVTNKKLLKIFRIFAVSSKAARKVITSSMTTIMYLTSEFAGAKDVPPSCYRCLCPKFYALLEGPKIATYLVV